MGKNALYPHCKENYIFSLWTVTDTTKYPTTIFLLIWCTAIQLENRDVHICDVQMANFKSLAIITDLKQHNLVISKLLTQWPGKHRYVSWRSTGNGYFSRILFYLEFIKTITKICWWCLLCLHFFSNKAEENIMTNMSVSYTHLTLPTIYSV